MVCLMQITVLLTSPRSKHQKIGYLVRPPPPQMTPSPKDRKGHLTLEASFIKTLIAVTKVLLSLHNHLPKALFANFIPLKVLSQFIYICRGHKHLDGKKGLRRWAEQLNHPGMPRHNRATTTPSGAIVVFVHSKFTNRFLGQITFPGHAPQATHSAP